MAIDFEWRKEVVVFLVLVENWLDVVVGCWVKIGTGVCLDWGPNGSSGPGAGGGLDRHWPRPGTPSTGTGARQLSAA